MNLFDFLKWIFEDGTRTFGFIVIILILAIMISDIIESISNAFSRRKQS